MLKQFVLAAALAFAGCSQPASTPASKQPRSSAAAPAPAADPGESLASAAGGSLLNQPGPALSLKTIDGKTIDLKRLYGRKPVYLKFWATWCVPCREQMPHFEHAFEMAGDRMTVVGINTNFNETREGVLAYRKAHGLKMPIVIDDGRLAAALHLRVTPQHVVIGRDGRIAYVGHLASAALDAALRAAAAPSPPTSAGAPPPPGPPTPPAAFPASIATLDGRQFALVDRKPGGLTALVFLSPWCETYLKESQPSASAQCRQARLGTEEMVRSSPGVRWLGIAAGLWVKRDDLRDYRSKYAISMPLALDSSGDLFRAFHVTRVPTVLLIDADGRVVHRMSGDISKLSSLLGNPGRRGGPGS